MRAWGRWVFWGLAALGVAAQTALAGGPRFVTGSTFAAAGAGNIMAFYTSQPLYFTDPGNLSAGVTHAQADAMVAAAAAVWNVPTASLVLAQGGVLAEHVSGANSYFDGTQIVFPADVQASNYLAEPIAVVYDADGSVTDLLLGQGASEPSSCRQNGVVESVDAFGPTGTIEHALIVLNGRCVGTTPQQLTQMQYQLTRVFGRVLGLGWSQLNDNVFTGVPTPNADQAAYWPLMHPIDVICGPYTYLCLRNPFTLRTDDLSMLAELYPVTAANLTAGKTVSSLGAMHVWGYLEFPDYQGMEQVNVAVTRWPFAQPIEDFQIVSGMSGETFQEDGGNPVTERTVPAAYNIGVNNNPSESMFMMNRVPLGAGWYSLHLQTENINPLYWGEFAIGAYLGQPRSMSGPVKTDGGYFGEANADYELWDWTSAGAAASCNPGNDGVENAPVAVDASGWWTGQICGVGHTSWGSAAIKGGHSWTLEATALDETGAASAQKLRPVLGVWNAGDPTGTLPTVAATAAALNVSATGMTQLKVPAASADGSVRFTVADQFGAGRPDFSYQARVLYADSVTPGVVGAAGGRITIAGMGFRQGNRVTVNGVTAAVVSWTATQIVATAPSQAAAGVTGAALADVAVMDAATGGQTVMAGALGYSAAAVDEVQLVSAPAALETGVAAAVPFAVKVLASDGVTPAAGATVQFAVIAGSAALGACGAAATCALTTDATGVAQTAVTGLAAGSITLRATEVSGGASVQATMMDKDPVRVVVLSGGPHYVAAGVPASFGVELMATQDGVAAVGQPVSWSATAGLSVSGAAAVTDATGSAEASVGTSGLAAGAQAAVTGCVWSTVCGSAAVYGVDASLWKVTVASGAGQSVVESASLAPVTLLVTDGQGHAVQGAAVTVYQTVEAWEGVCPVHGRCPVAPVLAASQSTGITDAEGWLQVTPLEVPGVPEVVNLAAAAGTQGFVAVALTKTP